MPVAAAAAATMMALGSTGDVLLLGVLLGLAAADYAAGAAGVLAGIAVVGRWGTTSLAALAGGQAVLGAAGWTGSDAQVASSWLAVGALLVVCPAALVPAAAFGATAAALVAGPAVDTGSPAADIALRVVAAVAGTVAAMVVARVARRSPRKVRDGLAIALGAAAALVAVFG